MGRVVGGPGLLVARAHHCVFVYAYISVGEFRWRGGVWDFGVLLKWRLGYCFLGEWGGKVVLAPMGDGCLGTDQNFNHFTPAPLTRRLGLPLGDCLLVRPMLLFL